MAFKNSSSATTHLKAQPGEPYTTYRHLFNRLSILPKEIVLIIITALLDLSRATRIDVWLTATNLVKASPLHAGPLLSTAVLRARNAIWLTHRRTDPAFSERYWHAPGAASPDFSEAHPGEKDRQSDAERRRVEVFGGMAFLKGLALRVRALRRGELEPVYLPRFRFDDYCPFYRGEVGEVGVMRGWWYYYDDGAEL